MACPYMLKSFLSALVVCWMLPAHAGDAASAAGSTDRLIVKYRGLAPQARPDARSISRALTVAARHRMSLRPVPDHAAGAHVLQLDRCISMQDAATLASDLEAGDAQIEFAQAEPSDHAAADPADSACGPAPGSRYATAR
jgi:serine protease